jgi:hypothetical protein
MTTDAAIAIIHTQQPEVAVAIGKLAKDQQDQIATVGGVVTLAKGKSPNGMNCTLIARVASNATASVFAVADDGREQPVAVGNAGKVMAMIN